ncbi:MAG: SMC family ATPase [Anaerolineales bacterium]|nr:MAG: SMC family ATPase [Anaerolineales bacterium]
MIPLRLQLRNFMCYREVEALDFSGFHLACLAGDNGHGKSALLDAVTWALWGKTRLGARRDDELIHLGQTEMEVEFTFALDGNRYRVIRKRDSRGKGQSALELQAWDDPVFRPLTEPTMRATQARINELLRMDYETFINSAFLLQGRADEFTIKAPAERKRILGDILGLSIYDEYEEQAKEQAKAKEQKAAEIAARIRDMDRELEHQPEYERELSQAESQAVDLTRTLQKAEGELRQLREEMKELDFKAAQIDDLSARLAQGEQELAELQEQVAAGEAHIADYEVTLSERQDIEKGFAALTRARQLNETLNLKLSQLVKLNERKTQLENTIAEARYELTTQQRLLAEKTAELETRAEKAAELEADLAAVRAQLESLTKLEGDRQARQQSRQELSNRVASLRTRNEQLKAEMEPLREKVDLLREAEARCPLCDSELSEADRDRLVAQFTAEGKEKANLHRANQAEIKDLSSQSEALQREVEAIDRELKDKPTLQKREATLEKELGEAQAAAQALAEARANAAAVEEKLAAQDYAPAEQARLAGLTAQLQKLGYDANVHEKVRQDLQVLARFEEAQARLQTALDQMDAERANLERLRHSQARKQATLAADLEKWDELKQAVARRPEVRQQVEEKEREVDRLQEKERRARDVVAAIKQQIAHCQYLVKERKKRVAERQKIVEEKAIYDELRVAFGKKGLQAMIIESAIPEIEDEANALLARMTDGRMNVRFETQRETKKGDTVETLDIKISDELGTRSYELFSGGERFRINFAIRIALSKLLARRAGARLQTLVIDEGFGTQDTQGRERLVEAINSIREDFEKIIVITHIEELRDLFPVRINVFKTPQGSQITVS